LTATGSTLFGFSRSPSGARLAVVLTDARRVS